MLVVPFDDSDVAEAEQIAAGFGKTTNPNYFGFEARVRGCLGDIIFPRAYPCATKYITFAHDFFLNGRIINVKTGHCRGVPQSCYDVNVLCRELPRLDNIGADLVFAKLTLEHNPAYLVGWMTLREFCSRAQLVHAGAKWHGLTYQKKSLVLTIDQLNDMTTLDEKGPTGVFECQP